MKLILPALLLTIAIFISSIEASSQHSNSSSSSQGSNGHRSGPVQRVNSRAFIHSYVEESGESRISTPLRRYDLAHSSSQRQEATSRYTGPGTRLPPQHSGPSNIRHSEALRYSGTSPPSSSRLHVHGRHPGPARSGQTSTARYQQGHLSNSAHQSESSGDSSTYTSVSLSIDSPRGPFSLPYDHPSSTSQSGSTHSSPNHSP